MYISQDRPQFGNESKPKPKLFELCTPTWAIFKLAKPVNCNDESTFLTVHKLP